LFRFCRAELTLYPELLQAGISLAHEKGFVTRLVTNAWWAKTPEQAHDFAQNLRTAGLDELNSRAETHAVAAGNPATVSFWVGR
jgi:hypothetical protein